MKLTLIPQWGRGESTLSVSGDVLVRIGMEHDLSDVPDGGEIWPQHPAHGEDHVFIGAIRRVDGEINATVIVHLDESAPYEQPGAPWVVTVTDGPVEIPAIRTPQIPEE